MPWAAVARYRRARMILELAHDGAVVRLRLEADPRGEQRALVHAGGYALSHAGALAPGPLRELVLAAAKQLAARAAEPVTVTVTESVTVVDESRPAASIIGQLRRIVGALAPTAQLTLVRAGQPAPPRWPSSLRTGAPGPGQLWPFDAELAGLRLGLRRIVKREAFDDEAEAADRAWLAAAGVATARVGPVDPDGRRVLLGSLAPLVPSLAAAELALRGSDDADPAGALGDALGYPPCCIARFVAGGRDDRSILVERAPDALGPASPLSLWLNPPLALISHVPCSLHCAPTVGLAAALLDELDRASPGFAVRWTELAARLHVIDERGRGLALAGDGNLATGFRIAHAVAFAVPTRADLTDLVAPRPDAVGRTLYAADVIASADHRG